MSQHRERGELEHLEERVLAEIPRGRDGRELLRMRFVRARTPEGKEVAWHDVREFWRGDDGQWRPGRKGISIRTGELGAIAVAFLRACASRVPPHLHALIKELVAVLVSSGEQPAAAKRQELPHEYYDRRHGRAPR